MMQNANCTACPLHKNVKTVCVGGRTVGTYAGAFIVGEAPGKQEDESGQVFTGRSGKLLSDALKEFSVDDYYITNTVKCHREGPPKPDEVKACATYLDAEIAHYKPQAILALGASAWKRLGGKGSITDEAGREIWSDKYQCWIMPALHPAAVLRAMGKEAGWKMTIGRYSQLLRGQLSPKPPVTVTILRTREAVHDFLGTLIRDRERINRLGMAYDIETTRYHWSDKRFKVRSIGFSYDGTTAYVIPLDDPKSCFSTDEVKAIWVNLVDEMQATYLIAHNAPFDDLGVFSETGVRIYADDDTMAMWQLFDENNPKALKWLGRTVLGWPDWSVDTENVPYEDLLVYNGYDAAATWLLKQAGYRKFQEDERLYSYYKKQVIRCDLQVAEESARNGIYVDRMYLDKAHLVSSIKLTVAADDVPVENPGSTQQVAKWLYEDQKLPIIKYTPAGAPSTDEETIHRLAQTYPDARKVLEYRKHAKNLGTYLTPVQERLDNTKDKFKGRLYYEHRLATETGRLTSPYHTIPRDEFIRDIYWAEQPGRELISGDYSQIEARLVAWAAAGRPPQWNMIADPRKATLLLAFQDPDRDVYKEMAAAALNKGVAEITSQERQIMGKVPTLACLYRISAEGLQDYAWREYQVNWTYSQAQHLHKTFYELWPEIAAWHRQEEVVIRKQGFVVNVLGRIRHLPEALTGDSKSRQEAVKQGINFPIQSLAWSITSLAARNFVKRTQWDDALDTCLLVGTVHDSIQVDVPWNKADDAAGLIYDTMINAPLIMESLALPDNLIQVEIKRGRWGSGKKISVDAK